MLLMMNTAMANYCTVVIRDQYGYDYDQFTSSSYSTDAACDDATWNCRQKLSEYQGYGRHYDAVCTVKTFTPNYPMPPIPPSYPPSYPPRRPDYPREPGRDPHFPRLPDHGPNRGPGREPPRHEPGSQPRYPGPRPHFHNEVELESDN